MDHGPFPQRRFNVEHALSMHAHSFVFLPAFALYRDDLLDEFGHITKNCHIYLIGYTSEIRLQEARQEGKMLITAVYAQGKVHELGWPLEQGETLVLEDGVYDVVSADGRRFPGDAEIMVRIHARDEQAFHVLYVGQAYGKDGSRNALDRLKSHETLQKIAIHGVPPGKQLMVLLLEVQPENQVIMVFNPKAKDQTQGEERLMNGYAKLHGTSEQERIALYEASLIRYFQPQFNKEFKDSFPSTNLKILRDCYDKDFAAVTADISFDELPFSLTSDTVAMSRAHAIHHPLHSAEERQLFFGWMT